VPRACPDDGVDGAPLGSRVASMSKVEYVPDLQSHKT
jgi:hypothetical protein